MHTYSDDKMIFDDFSGRYILTEQALIDNGTDIRKRLEQNRTVNATAVINRVLHRVSDMIYNYIHKFNADNKQQDLWIATIPSLREIIYRAMLEQAEYFLMNGDLSRSVEREKREFAVDYSAQETLNTAVPELGVPITYQGGY